MRTIWPNELQYKTRIPLSSLKDDAAFDELFKWLTDNVGELGIDWHYRKNLPFPSPPVKMNNLNVSFKRDEDRIKFILKWC